MRTLHLATTNPHKIREMRDLLRDLPVRVEALDLTGVPEPEETGATFEANARIKALAYAALTPGLVVSEDSGLEIDALGGAPGIHSARFLGPAATYAARFAAILGRLEGVPDARRTARFVCALAVAEAGRVVFETRGVVEGRIAHAAAGDGGFGYDPIFYYPEFGCTLAEAGPLKDTVSHRAHAIRALAHWLRDLQ
jgi:XTP/dITP diphosphohydrolase